MRQKTAIALAWIRALDSQGNEVTRRIGKPAKDLTEQEALRIRSRAERRRFGGTEAMVPAQLERRARQRRRARQTHPGKRGQL